MDVTTSWSMILGVLTPLLVSVINRPAWDNNQKRIVAVVVSALVGIVNLIVQGQLDNFDLSFNHILVTLALVMGAAQAAFTLLWKPTGVSDTVEVATSPKTPVVAPVEDPQNPRGWREPPQNGR